MGAGDHDIFLSIEKESAKQRWETHVGDTRSEQGLGFFIDGTNDISKWRLDILYGVKTVDSRLAHRVSGTA